MSPDDGLGFGVRGSTEGAAVSVGSLAAQDRTARRGVEALALSADGHLAGGADSARGFAGSRQRATTGRRARAGARSGLRARLAGVRRQPQFTVNFVLVGVRQELVEQRVGCAEFHDAGGGQEGLAFVEAGGGVDAGGVVEPVQPARLVGRAGQEGQGRGLVLPEGTVVAGRPAFDGFGRGLVAGVGGQFVFQGPAADAGVVGLKVQAAVEFAGGGAGAEQTGALVGQEVTDEGSGETLDPWLFFMAAQRSRPMDFSLCIGCRQGPAGRSGKAARPAVDQASGAPQVASPHSPILRGSTPTFHAAGFANQQESP